METYTLYGIPATVSASGGFPVGDRGWWSDPGAEFG
jgi:hypothetical protein